MFNLSVLYVKEPIQLKSSTTMCESFLNLKLTQKVYITLCLFFIN